MRRWLIIVLVAALCLHPIIVNYHTRVSSVLEPQHELKKNTRRRAPIDDDLNFTNAVHVVVSRFMQHQPNLLALGRARLKLFETICLQSLRFQDTRNFLWLILIDPQLHPELLEEMKHVVAPYSNFFLIRSQESDIRLRSVNTSSVESGDVNLLSRATKAVRSTLLVYTRLDADDGLGRTALRRLRTLAITQLASFSEDLSKGWVSYCISGHFEWHPSVTEAAGTLIHSQEPFCVTPGLSFAFAPGTSFSKLPTTSHNRLHNVMPPCRNRNQTACLHRTNEIKMPLAIRPRTAASGGMHGVGKDVDSYTMSAQQIYWKTVESQFNIKQQSLVNLQHYLHKNVRAIAQDNLDGQW